MPNINPQPKRPLLHLLPPINITQHPHSNNLIQPVQLPNADLKKSPQLQPTTRLRGPARANENVRPVVRPQIIPRVGAEDARARVREAPVGAEGEDGSWRGVSRVRVGVRRLIEWGCALPLRRGPVKLPPMMGIAVRVPRGPGER